MDWSGDHRAFVAEELIENGVSPIMTQRAFPVLVSATSQPQGYCVVCHF
jgi:hypothetical protein